MFGWGGGGGGLGVLRGGGWGGGGGGGFGGGGGEWLRQNVVDPPMDDSVTNQLQPLETESRYVRDVGLQTALVI